ncbi:MAG TPA: hypothetical protein VGR43_06285 [Dehalococcoidia bacterium]|nr:hypothetical protein [Dehalococcoidia bacterium]
MVTTIWLTIAALTSPSTGGGSSPGDLIRSDGSNPLDGGLLGDVIDGQEPPGDAPAPGVDESTATATPESEPTPTPEPEPTALPEPITEASDTPTPTSSASPSATPTPTLAPTPSPTAPPLPCSRGLLLDFAGISPGAVIDEQYASSGIHISGQAYNNGPNAVIVFDSNAPPTHDEDLAVDLGNIAILAKNLNDQNADGLVDDPDENNSGGKQIYSFDKPVAIGSFLFIDQDHNAPEKTIAYDSGGNEIKRVLIPVAGDGSVQTVHVDAANVSRLVIDYRESAALTQIEVCFQDPTPTPPSVAISTATPPPSPSPTPTALEIVSLPSTGGDDGSSSSYFGLAVLITGAMSLVAASLVAIRFGGKREADQD